MKKFALLCLTAISLLTACNSPGGDGSKASATTAQTITDAKLRPFMLGGIYFFHGYGGANATFNKLMKEQMDHKPGEDGFIEELHKLYTNYFYYPFAPEDGAGARETLKEWWDIHNGEEFKARMEKLLAEGQQSVYERLSVAGAQTGDEDEKARLAFITAHKSEFPKGGIKSWDIARYVNNTAMGYAAGYITQAEGDAMLSRLPDIAHQYYSSWAEYWNGYNLGRKFWGGDPDNDAVLDKDVADMQQGDYSLYRYMPW